MPAPEAFTQILHIFFERVTDPLLRRLLLLSCLGESGPFGYALHRQFRELGIVHLLVLSGSQVVFYAEGLRFLFARIFYLSGSLFWPRWMSKIGMLYGFWIFGAATHWPSPLTRALFMESIKLLWPGLYWPYSWCLALSGQILVFPDHLSSLGFYLSWAASLGLKWGSVFRWSFAIKLIAVSILGQVLVGLLVPQSQRESALFWICALGANWIVGGIFEKTLMRVCGWVLAVTGVLAGASSMIGGVGWTGVWSWLGSPVRIFLEGAATLVLVAVDAFRYIYNP